MSYHSAPLGFSFSAEGSASVSTKPKAPSPKAPTRPKAASVDYPVWSTTFVASAPVKDSAPSMGIMGAIRGLIDKAKQRYGASIAESMAKARTAGQAQAQSYGEFLLAVTAELRACGVPETELKKVTDQAWRDAALAECRSKAAAAAAVPRGIGPLGWVAILGGVAAVGGGTYYLLK